MILHPEGLTRGSPEKAKVVLILNKGEIEKGLELGTEVDRIIKESKSAGIEKILVTSLIPKPEIMAIL